MEFQARHNNKLFSTSLQISLDILSQEDNPPSGLSAVWAQSLNPHLLLGAQETLWKNQWKKQGENDKFKAISP